MTLGLDHLLSAAVQASDRSFTVTDPNRADNPLVYVNPAFTRVTGYTYDEAVGRNCRFLQGPLTSRAAIDEITGAIAERGSVTTTLLNYRRDGSSFWNEVAVSAVFGPAGELTHFVGVQTDVSDRVYAERARDAAIAQAQKASVRLTMLASFMRELARSLQADEAIDLLARFLVPHVATWCAVYLLDPDGPGVIPRVFHSRRSVSDGIAAQVRRLESVEPGWQPPPGPLADVLSGERQHALLTRLGSADGSLAGPEGRPRWELFRSLGSRSVIIVPMIARNEIIGAVAVVTDKSRPELVADDLEAVSDLANRTALMVETLAVVGRRRR